MTNDINVKSDCLDAALLKVVNMVKEELKIFPIQCCLYSSGKVKQKLGLEMKYGYFINLDGLAEEHYWNMAPSGKEIIDITAAQFDKTLPTILRIPVDSKYAQDHYVFLD